MSFRAKLFTAIASLLVTTSLFAADSQQAVTAVVSDFNAAVTARDVDAIMATLAEGSVQIQLRPMHPGMPDNPRLTGDLRKNWQMVAAILFPASDAYERKATITDVVVNGDVATVWTDTRSHTQRTGKEPLHRQFTEVYLLVKKDDRWQIATIADNRQPGNIRVDGEGQAD